jgi:hypothetical protein
LWVLLTPCRARGGLEAEREERERCILEEQEKERRNFEALQRVREEGYRKVRWEALLSSSSSGQLRTSWVH